MVAIITGKPIGKPAAWTSLGVIVAAVIVRPWGNYPLNDDWQYARIVKRLAETGRFFVDVSIAPSLAGQAWLAAAVVRLFGFSHTTLRILTMVVAAGLLWLIDRILRLAGAKVAIRALAMTLLLANPIVLHLTFSFLTEIYGYGLAFLGAFVWLQARARRTSDDRIVSWPAGITASILIGAAFWIRQFSAALFPALVGAALWRLYGTRGRRAIADNLPRVLALTASFMAVVVAYFVWAKITGNYSRAFGDPLRSLVHIDPALVTISTFEIGTYLTLFLFPFLLLERWRPTKWSAFAAVATAAMLGIGIARALQPTHASFHHHVRFPFSANVVSDTAVGPITFSTTYWDAGSPRPHWPAAVWTAVEWVLVGGLVLWSRLVAGARDEPPLAPLAAEIRTFGVLLAAISFGLSVQAYQWQVLDRYYLPVLFGALIALGARATRGPGSGRAWLAIAAVLPLAWFSVAGLHDYFRWNDARWRAVAAAEADGATPDVLDGGFEVNGWLNYDAATRGDRPERCRGACHCAPFAFYCTDDSYVISMEVPPGRTAVATFPIDWWLADGPAVILSRR